MKQPIEGAARAQGTSSSRLHVLGKLATMVLVPPLIQKSGILGVEEVALWVLEVWLPKTGCCHRVGHRNDIKRKTAVGRQRVSALLSKEEIKRTFSCSEGGEDNGPDPISHCG